MSELNLSFSLSFTSIDTPCELIVPSRPQASEETKQKALRVLEKAETYAKTTVALKICSFLEPQDPIRENL